jgi:hypothetical protein
MSSTGRSRQTLCHEGLFLLQYRHSVPRLLTAAFRFSLCVTVLSGGLVFAEAEKYEADTRLAIVDKYVDATQVQQHSLRGLQMEVDIDAELPKLEKHGKLRALRKISQLGLITYKALGFSGDNTVKQEVITRYLAAESAARENGTIAITPANYKFRYAGRIIQNNVTMVILQVTPKKKAVGLFKGDIWIDAATGMPLREAGQFVKTPSVFLKKIAFVREYEIRGGVAYPKHIQSTVDTRIVGRAELEISFSNFSRDNGDDQAAAGDSDTVGSASGPATEIHTSDLSTAPDAINKSEQDSPEL